MMTDKADVLIYDTTLRDGTRVKKSISPQKRNLGLPSGAMRWVFTTSKAAGLVPIQRTCGSSS
jgi:hypothetical protein